MLSPAFHREIIHFSLAKAGLTISTGHEVDFIVTAHAALGFLHWKNLRCFGRLLDKERVQALGVRANTKLSVEFVGILNETGLRDPIGAANVIAQTVGQGLSSASCVFDARAHGFARLRFRASTGAAGPCSEAAKLDDKVVPLTDAVVLPLASCKKLGQCFCRYQFAM